MIQGEDSEICIFRSSQAFQCEARLQNPKTFSLREPTCLLQGREWEKEEEVKVEGCPLVLLAVAKSYSSGEILFIRIVTWHGTVSFFLWGLCEHAWEAPRKTFKFKTVISKQLTYKRRWRLPLAPCS